ncbi:hypothetical protein AAC387_Pa07g3519 [Persea americana]
MRMGGLSYAQIGGKAANAALPPLKTAEKLQVQDFLHSERRKTCRCSFTAAENGGKAAGAGFPPVAEEENLQLQFYRLYKRR